MKTIIVSSILLLSSIFSAGCATSTGAAIGYSVDKHVLGGDGLAGAVIGAHLGDVLLKPLEDRKITVKEDGTIAMRCQNHYSYSTRGGPAVMEKTCAGPSIERMPTNGFPTPPAPSYKTDGDQKAAALTTTPCHRYNIDGTINADCR